MSAGSSRIRAAATQRAFHSGDNVGAKQFASGVKCSPTPNSSISPPRPPTESGSQIEAMSETKLAAASVFARLAPAHKERIIHALRGQGHSPARSHESPGSGSSSSRMLLVVRCRSQADPNSAPPADAVTLIGHTHRPRVPPQMAWAVAPLLRVASPSDRSEPLRDLGRFPPRSPPRFHGQFAFNPIIRQGEIIVAPPAE